MKKTIYTFLLGSSLLLTTACDNSLDQLPENIALQSTITDFSPVLNAAYFYHVGTSGPMAVMGDFRADNAFMDEEPYPAFDRFNADLTDMENDFFGPLYTALYRVIISSNTVILNSTDATEVGEAKFLRALAYFKGVQVFGDLPIQSSDVPDASDTESLIRQPVDDIYNSIIIPDLIDASSVLSTQIVDGRASRLAAKGLLGKVYATRGDYGLAEVQLADVINTASGAGISLEGNFADIFGFVNEGNSEIIFASQKTVSITDEYGFSDFWEWSGGLDTKSLLPLDPDLIAAFDASEAAAGTTDLRRAVTIDETLNSSSKFPQTDGSEHDWIELRLADVILLYAEALNENGASAAVSLGVLDDLRQRAGLPALDPTVITTQAMVKQAILDERRLELAFEGQRWFDLVRTGTASAEMGETIDNNFLIAPIPLSEVLVTSGVTTQNPGY